MHKMKSFRLSISKIWIELANDKIKKIYNNNEDFYIHLQHYLTRRDFSIGKSNRDHRLQNDTFDLHLDCLK